MGKELSITIATTTLATDNSAYERVRAGLALQTISAANSRNYTIIAVDGGSSGRYIDKLRYRGAKVFPQEESGMGNARRQALRIARNETNDRGAVVWLEPEKSTLVPSIHKAADKIIFDKYDMCLFRRRSLESYPPEQANIYQLGELAFKYLTGIKCDFLFGPVALNRRSVDYFLSYNSNYGDAWDSIHIPKLKIMRDNLRWTQVTIDYNHPQEQTSAEQGNIDLFIKRIEQIKNVASALKDEITNP